MHQLTTSPPAESHYLLLEKLKELHYRVNIFVAIGIPYLVNSMQAVHGIRDIMLCEATFAHFYSKELPEMPILIFFTIINICFDFPIPTMPQ